MTLIRLKKLLLYLFLIGPCYSATAQLGPNVYISEEKMGDNTTVYQWMMDSEYAILSIYKTSPPEFVKTLGGFYSLKNDALEIKLEFNSNFVNDSLKQLHIPFTKSASGVQFELDDKKDFEAVPKVSQDLDGKWLFAARAAELDKGRRESTNPRKTMKFLLNSHFQWIAFNTDKYEFFGTGGGTFSSKDANYEEKIEFFSKDNSRVGQKLGFMYELQGNDWHHTGKSSKGEPLAEIWAKRNGR